MRELNNLLALVRGHDLYMSSKVDLIASNSCISNFARLALSSTLPNNYCIGLPGARLYGGCTYIDMIEREVHSLLRQIFGNTKHVVVQFLSGMQANIGAYNAILKPNDTIIAAETRHGGHYSHTIRGPLRFYSPRIVSLPFDDSIYNVDLNKLEEVVKKERPKLMILGWSEFLFPHPLEHIRQICDRYQVKIHYDMSHVVGLIAGGVFQPDAMRYADILTSSTGKSLHAPDHGIVMYNDDAFHPGVLEAVMPLLTSNTHPQEVAGLGVALTESLHFGHAYAKQVVANTKALGKALNQEGINVLYGDLDYSESHTLLVEYQKAHEAVTMLDRAGVLTSACQLPWDQDNETTGLRFGTQAITRRGYTEKDMPEIANIISQVLLKNKEPEILLFSQVTPLSKKFHSIRFSFDDEFPIPGGLNASVFNLYAATDTPSILRSSPSFANCTLEEIDSIVPDFEILKLEEPEILFSANKKADSVYFVAHGWVEIFDESDGKKTLIATMGENTHFGELGVMSGKNRKYSAQTQGPCILLKIKDDSFLKILKRFPSIEIYFERYLVSLNEPAH